VYVDDLIITVSSREEI
jgi:hypothetical protein